MYFNKETHKYVTLQKYHTSVDKSLFRKYIHYGIYEEFEDGRFILSHFTTPGFSRFEADDVSISYENVPNNYSDDLYINNTYLFSAEMKKYFKIEVNQGEFLSFFRRKDMFKNASSADIFKAVLKDYYLSMLASTQIHSIDYVEPGVPNTKIDPTTFYDESLEALQLKSSDTTEIEDIVKELLETSVNTIHDYDV